LIHGLELADDRTFRFKTLLIVTARQSGKSTLLQILALWRLYLDAAPLVIGTAQNLPLAEEVWAGALDMAQGVPELAAEVAAVSRTNGDKFFRLTGGQRYKVAAATRSGSRGLSSDLVLLDELREHRDWEAWASSTKTTMARPSPQVIAFSNAGDKSSIVLASLREKALAAAADRSTRLGIFEWSAADGCELDDREAWAQANPALGHRMSEDAISAALEVDPEGVFRTEILCQWVQSVESAIAPAVWASLAGPTPERGHDVVFSLDIAPGHETATICSAWTMPSGLRWVQVADHRPGVDWIVARWDELRSRWGGSLTVEQTGTAGFLLPRLSHTVPVPRRFYTDSCSTLADAVSSAGLRHGNQDPLNEAVAVARWSSSGDAGQRVLARRDARVSPLVAAALALHALSLPPPVTGGWMVGV